jgi:orotidine-5'-phosphate decarboxylase
VSEARIIVALDLPSAEAALKLALTLSPAECKLKVGKELFVASGPKLVESLVRLGFDVFLDLKFHDIPNTVAAACRAAMSLGVWMINVHACGGSNMLRAAREAIPGPKPKLIAVTLLTSIEQRDLQEIGVVGLQDEVALRWAKLAHASGLDGVVCSAHEVKIIKQEFGADFLAVTPGIRLAASNKDDQRRIASPQTAIEAGADYLVVGRPIVQAQDPHAVVRQINQEIDALVAT